MEAIFQVLMGSFLLGGLIVIVLYVLQALCLYKALMKVEYANAWMAWIPLLSYYAVADTTTRDEKNSVNVLGLSVPSALFNFWWLVVLACSAVPGIGAVAALVIQISCFGTALTELYAKVKGTSKEQEKVLGYVSSVISFVQIIALWEAAFSKKENA